MNFGKVAINLLFWFALTITIILGGRALFHFDYWWIILWTLLFITFLCTEIPALWPFDPFK